MSERGAGRTGDTGGRRDPFKPRRASPDPPWVTAATEAWSTVMPGQRHPSEQADLRAAAEEWVRRHREGGVRAGVYRSTPDGVDLISEELVRPGRGGSASRFPTPVALPLGETARNGARSKEPAARYVAGPPPVDAHDPRVRDVPRDRGPGDPERGGRRGVWDPGDPDPGDFEPLEPRDFERPRPRDFERREPDRRDRRRDRREFEPRDYDPRDYDRRDYDPRDYDPREYDRRGFEPRRDEDRREPVGRRLFDPRDLDPREAPPPEFEPGQFPAERPHRDERPHREHRREQPSQPMPIGGTDRVDREPPRPGGSPYDERAFRTPPGPFPPQGPRGTRPGSGEERYPPPDPRDPRREPRHGRDAFDEPVSPARPPEPVEHRDAPRPPEPLSPPRPPEPLSPPRPPEPVERTEPSPAGDTAPAKPGGRRAFQPRPYVPPAEPAGTGEPAVPPIRPGSPAPPAEEGTGWFTPARKEPDEQPAAGAAPPETTAPPVSAPPVSAPPVPAPPVPAPPVPAPPVASVPPVVSAPPVSSAPPVVSAPPADTAEPAAEPDGAPAPEPAAEPNGAAAPEPGQTGRDAHAEPDAPAPPEEEPDEPPEPPEPPAPPDPEQRLSAYTWRFDPATLRELVDEPEDLRDVRDRLTEKVTAATDNATRARLLSLRSVVSRLLMELGAALADGKLALAHAEATGELRRIAIAQARLAHAHQWRGEFADADRLFTLANSPELPDRLRAALHEHAGRCSFDQGRFIEACDHLDKAMALRKVEDPELIARTAVALDAIIVRVGEGGWGPYPRTREELLGGRRPPIPAYHEKTQRWGYVGPTGQPVTPADYAEARPFADGVAWARRPETRTWELVDATGTVLIDASAGYVAAGPFSDGLAWVVRDGTRVWVAIDRGNRVVIPTGYDDVRTFHAGLAAVRRGGWGAVDTGGRVVVPMRYAGFPTTMSDGRFVDGFTDEGLAVVDAGDGKGVVDRAGRILVPPRHRGLAIHPVAFLMAGPDARWGALDRRGEPLIDPVHPHPAAVVDELDRLLADTKPVL